MERSGGQEKWRPDGLSVARAYDPPPLPVATITYNELNLHL